MSERQKPKQPVPGPLMPLATELELMLREQHKIGYAAGYRAGQEAMRERAGKACESVDENGFSVLSTNRAVASCAIECCVKSVRALPIVEPDADK